jgi:hypothetical protein
MSIFDNSTSYNPLYLEDADGLDADFDEAVMDDNYEEVIAGLRARKRRKWGLDEEIV